MAECDAFNLIDEYIKQSHCHSDTKGSTPALTTSDYSFSSKSCSKSSPDQSDAYNTIHSTNSKASSDRTSKSSYESANELLNVNDTAKDVTTSELDQIFVSLKMSKALSYENSVFLTPPRSEKFEQTIQDEHNFLDVSHNLTSGKAPGIKPPPPAAVSDMFAELYPQKPKRPYSYYAATNFHPLDLTAIEAHGQHGPKETSFIIGLYFFFSRTMFLIAHVYGMFFKLPDTFFFV